MPGATDSASHIHKSNHLSSLPTTTPRHLALLPGSFVLFCFVFLCVFCVFPLTPFFFTHFCFPFCLGCLLRDSHTSSFTCGLVCAGVWWHTTTPQCHAPLLFLLPLCTGAIRTRQYSTKHRAAEPMCVRRPCRHRTSPPSLCFSPPPFSCLLYALALSTVSPRPPPLLSPSSSHAAPPQI
jgi:hypothetical protein